MERPEIDKVLYWESYRSGLLFHLENRRKGKYFGREVGARKKSIGEIDLDFEHNDEKLIRDEIDRISIIINFLNKINE